MTYNTPPHQMSEPDLEGRYAELSYGIDHGEYTGDVLTEAITERRLVWLEIVRCRVGEVDDEEREEYERGAWRDDEWDDDGSWCDPEWERWYYGSEWRDE